MRIKKLIFIIIAILSLISFAKADSNISLKGYLQTYKNNNPMLEYVLLVGDWNGAYSVPTFTIPSYNEEELESLLL